MFPHATSEGDRIQSLKRRRKGADVLAGALGEDLQCQFRSLLL